MVERREVRFLNDTGYAQEIARVYVHLTCFILFSSLRSSGTAVVKANGTESRQRLTADKEDLLIGVVPLQLPLLLRCTASVLPRQTVAFSYVSGIG